MVRFSVLLPVLGVGAAIAGMKVGGCRDGRSDHAVSGAALFRKSVPSELSGAVPSDITRLLTLAWPGQPEQAASRLWSEILPWDKARIARTCGEMPRQKAQGDAWRQVNSALLERWRELDPKAAALRPGTEDTAHEAVAAAAIMTSAEAREFLLRLPDLSNRARALQEYARALAARDPADACAFYQGLGPGQCRESVGTSIGSIWLAQDPVQALVWLKSLQPAGLRQGILQGALSEAAGTAPEAVAKIVAELPDSDSWLPITKVSRSFLKQGPDAAAGWIKSLPAGQGRDEALNMLIRSIPLQDSGKAMELIDSLSMGGRRRGLLDQLAGQFGSQDPDGGRRWLAGLEESDQVSALNRMCHAMAQSKTLAEIETFVAALPENLAEPAAEGIAGGLKFTDAVAWVERVYKDSEALAAARLALVRDGHEFSAAMAEFALSLPPSEERDRKINSMLFQGVAGNARDELLKWVDGLPTDQQRKLLPDVISNQSTFGGIDEVIKSVEKFRQLPGVTGGEAANALRQPLSNWLKADPEKALAWAASSPPAQLGETMKLAAQVYADRDAVAAAQWALRQESPEMILAAAQGLEASNAENMGPVVARLGARLPASEESLELLERSLPQLHQKNPEAAAKILQSGSFTPEQIQRLRNAVHPNQPAEQK